MKELLETNIYDVSGNVLICGTCLPSMQKEGYEELSKEYDTILSLCLEKDHINMAITKICGMISTGKMKSVTFASVNKSPHCTQLHYIKNEIKRVMGEVDIEIKNIIVQNNEIFVIDDEILSLSKDLVRLSKESR